MIEEAKKRKIGFFGGSFDPIHLGHLNLAIQILEQKGLDQILFCPARLSPTKQGAPPRAAPKHRMNMLRLSLEDLPCSEPYEGELLAPPPSYTVDTLKKMEGDQLYLILGEDLVGELDQWRDIEELLTRAPPLIGTRSGFSREKWDRLPQTLRVKIREGMCQIRGMDISSSLIRERLKKRVYCGHLLQEKVLAYIHQNGLYSPGFNAQI